MSAKDQISQDRPGKPTSGKPCIRSLVFLYALLSLVFLHIPKPALAKDSQLRQQLEAIHEQTGVGAVSYALVEQNKIVALGGIGQYSNEDTRQVTAQSIFRVGSITKTFTALAVMHLVEQGKLRLNQAVKSILPKIPLNNPWPETPVTLEMVLEHTAGLQDLTKKELNYLLPLSLQQAFQLEPEARQVQWRPSYHFSYSNAGAGYAARMIETVSKENYDNWFKRTILSVLGMHDSQLHWNTQLEKKLVTGYDSDLRSKIPYWHTLFRSFGGLNTSARDMAKFLLLFTRNTSKTTRQQTIISDASIKRIETPKTTLAAKSGLKLGYGLGIRNSYFKGRRLYGHSGDGDGYLAEFAYSKESRRGYFIVINAFRHDLIEEFTSFLNNWLIETLPNISQEVSLAPIKQLTQKELADLVGKYRKVSRRFSFHGKAATETIQIKRVKNHLYRCYVKKNSCQKLLPVTDGLFRTKKEPGASMAFVKAADGQLYFYDDSSYRRIH